VEAVAQEAPPRGVEDLLPAGGEVRFGYAGHSPTVKRTFVLDNRPALAQSLRERTFDLEGADMATRPSSRASLVVVGVVLLQALLVLWFAWPAARIAPRDLPIVVAGPAPAANAVADRLRTEHPGAFRITMAPDASAADQALRDRTAYGAFVVDPAGPSLHVASAASPTVTSLLTQAAQAQQARVVDVVPAPADDPRGTGFVSGFLPLLLTSVACGVALLFLVRAHAVRLVGVIAFAALAGLVATAALHWLGVLTGSYLVEAGAIGLLALAVTATVSGLGALLGPPGIGLGVVLAFLVGNPISGVSTAPELLPQPWGAIGQFLPPGTGASLLRSAAYFDGAGATRPLLVLAAWAAAGLALTAVGHFRDARRSGPAGQLGVPAGDGDQRQVGAER
jgi:hypothetical protein